MKLFLLSDTHCDQWSNSDFETLANRVLGPGGDLLVLAGDISEKPSDIERLIYLGYARYNHVVFVPGNHDFYHSQFDQRLERFKQMPQTRYRQQEYINGVHFVYATLWAFKFERYFKTLINDYRVIQGHNPAREGKADLEFLTEQVTPESVVVTHFAPGIRQGNRPLLMGAKYTPCPTGIGGLDQYFYPEVEDVPVPRLWCYGHTHESMYLPPYYSNQLGYRKETKTGFSSSRIITC